MAEIQTYPTGTPVGTDHVPYISDPAGTPALKLADFSAFGGGAGFSLDSTNTNSKLVTGTTETVVRTVTRSATNALAIISMAISMNEYGVAKTATIRLRQTDVSGTILWHATWTAASDSTSGEAGFVSGVVGDASPSGSWVLTVQVTAGTVNTEIWSASNALAILS